MTLFITAEVSQEVLGGVELFSPMGFLILAIGLVFTIGLPLTMILKGRKD